MKLISWNVNGIRACVQKGFLEFFREADADIFCLQETKLQAGQIELDLEGYEQYWNYAVKKGYSGTAVFTKKKPLNMTYGIGIEEHDQEGRVITLEFEEFYFVTVYTPNSQNELARLDYRMKWESDFLAYLKKLEEKKPVIFCGDLNVAHKEIDLKNPKTNRKNAGFTDEERGKFTEMLDAGFIDTFRYFYPDQEGIYSWWSYRFSARAKNAGWRIDYFCVSECLKDRLADAKILDPKISKQFLFSFFELLRLHSMDLSEKVEHIIRGELWIQLDISGQKSDLFPHLLRLFAHLMSIYINLAFCRPDDRGNTAQRSRLPCSIRSQKAINLAFSRSQRKIIDCRLDRICGSGLFHLLFIQLIRLGQILNLNHTFPPGCAWCAVHLSYYCIIFLIQPLYFFSLHPSIDFL